MANTTEYLNKNYNENRNSTHVMTVQKIIDFSTLPVVSGNTFDAIKIKAGTFLKQIHAVVLEKDTNTTSTVTFTRSVTGSGPSCLVTLDTDDSNNSSDPDATLTGSYCPADDTIRGTIGTADATNAKVLVVAEYFFPAPVGSI